MPSEPIILEKDGVTPAGYVVLVRALGLLLDRNIVVTSDEPIAPLSRRQTDTQRRDLMLVRLGWTIREDLPLNMVEDDAKLYRVAFEPWVEMSVVWRTGHIELLVHKRVRRR